MAEPPISLQKAAKRLTAAGDPVDRSTLSRYVKNHAADLRPSKVGNATVIDFERLVAHRRANLVQRSAKAFADDIDFGLERALKTRAERLRIQLINAETQGIVVPILAVQNAAHAGISMMKNALSNAAGDTAEALAKAFEVEANLIRPHIRQFERRALEYFVAGLSARQATPGA